MDSITVPTDAAQEAWYEAQGQRVVLNVNANRYLSACDARQCERIMRKIARRLNKMAEGDPYGWDIPTMRALGHGHLIDVGRMAENRRNALMFPIDGEV